MAENSTPPILDGRSRDRRSTASPLWSYIPERRYCRRPTSSDPLPAAPSPPPFRPGTGHWPARPAPAPPRGRQRSRSSSVRPPTDPQTSSISSTHSSLLEKLPQIARWHAAKLKRGNAEPIKPMEHIAVTFAVLQFRNEIRRDEPAQQKVGELTR